MTNRALVKVSLSNGRHGESVLWRIG